MGRKKDEHGSNSTYNNKKCRCDLCKWAHRQWNRDYRARKRLAVAAQENETATASMETVNA